MAPRSDGIEREIAQTRADMEARIVELRRRARSRLRRARRALLISVAVGAMVGVAAVGVLVVQRLLRPPTARERLARVLPLDLVQDLARWRQRTQRRFRRGLPPIHVHIGEGEAEEARHRGRWEWIAVKAARAAGTAAAGALAGRLLEALRPGRAR